jgi:hypothetical protein
VAAWLQDQYRGYVDPTRNKVIAIERNGRLPREADVLVCAEYQNFWAFANVNDKSSFTAGVKFYDRSGNAIINYPELHSARCSDKNKDTGGAFKPTVRILKNMRRRLIEDQLLADGVAPS